MTRTYARRVRQLEQMHQQRHAAVQAIARERVLRQVLEEFDPQEDDAHLGYGELLDRVAEVVGVERRRVAEK